MNKRTLLAWGLSIVVHASVLVSVGVLTLAGGRPAQPGVTEIAINLSAPPAPAPKVTPQAAPEPKPKPKPKAKPKPKPKPVVKRPEPKPEPKPVPVEEVVEETTTPVDEQLETAQQTASQNQQQGAKGIAGDPGKGADQSGDNDSLLKRYLATVRNTIEDNKQYPHRARMRRQEGTVKISFAINAKGLAEQVELADSSGSRILDRATLELLSRLRFEAPPRELKTIPVSITVPVSYNLNNS